MSVVPQKIKDWLNKKIVGKTELTKTFSLKVSAAAPSEKAPMTPVEKELVFEKENQAVLSSDQLRVLYQWWKELSPAYRLAIEKKKAVIFIEGYTSHSGDDTYNYKLGLDRAKHCEEMLKNIIGTIDGKSIAIIRVSTSGEFEESKRYVKITIRNNN